MLATGFMERKKPRPKRSGQNRRRASKPRLVPGHAYFVYMHKLRQGYVLLVES